MVINVINKEVSKRMLKRILSFMLCVVCLTAVIGGTMMVSARASKVDFSLTTTDGGIGDTVTLSVSLSADSYFTNTTMTIYYDPSVVQFSEERAGAISPSSAMFMALDFPEDGYVRGAYVAAKPIKKSGVLVEYDFVIMQETEMVFSIGFDECVGEDENGTMFDVDYNAGSCVLNRGKGKPATTTAAKATTRVTEVSTANTNKNTTVTTASNAGGTTNAPTTTQSTSPVTYPTDQNGITLAPNVVTESDGNAATQPNGDVVTVVTTVPTEQGTSEADGSEGSSEEQEPADSSATKSNRWVVPLIVVLAAVAIASGAAAVIKRRKQTDASDKTPEA